MKEKQVSVVKIPELLPCKATFPFDAITRAKSDQCPPSNINSKKKRMVLDLQIFWCFIKL